MISFIKILFNFFLWNLPFFLIFLILIYLIRLKLKKSHQRKYGSQTNTISFIHPFCADCGGGEKVLWMIIKALSTLPENEGKKLSRFSE